MVQEAAKLRMRYLPALLLAMLAGHAPAQPAPPWNPKAPENGQLLPAFTLANVGSVLTAVGARYQRSGTDPAKPALLAVFPNGRKVLLSLASCDSAGGACKGLTIQSFWTKSATVPPERTADATARFNQRFAFAKALVLPDGRPSLERYLIADYGFVRGNLSVNLLVFADLAERFGTEFLQPLTSAAGK